MVNGSTKIRGHYSAQQLRKFPQGRLWASRDTSTVSLAGNTSAEIGSVCVINFGENHSCLSGKMLDFTILE